MRLTTNKTPLKVQLLDSYVSPSIISTPVSPTALSPCIKESAVYAVGFTSLLCRPSESGSVRGEGELNEANSTIVVRETRRLPHSLPKSCYASTRQMLESGTYDQWETRWSDAESLHYVFLFVTVDLISHQMRPKEHDAKHAWSRLTRGSFEHYMLPLI